MDKAFLLALVVFVGACAQWGAWRLKLPAILFLLIAGIVLGPVLNILNSDALFGDLLIPITTLSVSIILFEGGLTLRMHEIKGISSVVKRLVSIGAAITMTITTVVTHYVLELSWSVSALFGAVTVVTGPTVIVPMLRAIRPTMAVSKILRWEGIIIDPIGAFLAVIVYELIHAITISTSPIAVLITFAKLVGIGIGLGGGFAYIFGIVLKKHLISEYLKKVMTLALVIFVFSLSNLLQHESGILSVTIMGMWLANLKDADIADILDFKESLSVLLISLLFIILAARVDIDAIFRLGPKVIIVLLAIQFVSRPISIWLSTIGSKITVNERHLLSWIAPRGIVAAAISALFALKLELLGDPDYHLIVPLTFMVIIFTVTLQSLTTRWIALKLGLAEKYPKGIIFIGANVLSINIAKELKEAGYRPLMVDSNWENIKKARMEGFNTYFGSATSPHASKHLDLIGIGKMLALSPHAPTNSSCMNHFKVELEPQNIFSVLTDKDKEVGVSRRGLDAEHGQILFGDDVTYSILVNKLSNNWEIKSTAITESYSEDNYNKKFNNKAIKLFAISETGKLEVFTKEMKPELGPGSTLISLAPIVSLHK